MGDAGGGGDPVLDLHLYNPSSIPRLDNSRELMKRTVRLITFSKSVSGLVKLKDNIVL